MTDSDAPLPAARKTPWWQRVLPWLVTLGCFAYLYSRIESQAAREGQHTIEFLLGVFQGVSWWRWLALMVPYSAFFFLVDSLVVWRIINWFNTRVRYTDILPIRGSAYIISILNEQVGKGVMAIYLNRRDNVPGWQVGSSMLFIMFCEFYYLLAWATVGYALRGDALPEQFGLIPWVCVGAAICFVLWLLYFRGTIAPGSRLRDRQILHAFRQAKWWQYGVILLLRSPALLAAVAVYTLALRLFGLEANFLDLLGYLPLIFFGAAVPTPMRAVAITLWSFLYPENPARASAFGLVQHNFFIFFNAAIGLMFLRRANRELFGSKRSPAAHD
ncbi:hypothetical protein MK489_01265 [Myxococcota bacterium]|nr:hypothetical protein [Myxococcota bacterium]